MLKELVRKNRSYRRFDGKHQINIKTLIELINLARFCASAANIQPIRFHLSNSATTNSKIFETLSWAGFLTDWDGPEEDETPSAYITLLSESTPKYLLYDAGIVSQTILLGASELGLGGCIIGSIDKDKLKENLNFSFNYNIISVIALGKPIEEVKLHDTSDETRLRYWRDENIHYVPKLKSEKLVVNYFELM